MPFFLLIWRRTEVKQLPEPLLSKKYLIEEMNDGIDERIVDFEDKVDVSLEVLAWSFDSWYYGLEFWSHARC